MAQKEIIELRRRITKLEKEIKELSERIGLLNALTLKPLVDCIGKIIKKKHDPLCLDE